MQRNWPIFAVCLVAIGDSGANAGVTRLEIESVAPAPAAPGAGAYEVVSGRFYGELDPAAPGNRIITDIALAPRNARGKVEYSATFAIARPVEASQRSGVLFYDVPNRGMGGLAADPGGYVRVISGWQADIAEGSGLQTLRAPIARQPNGRPLTGPVLARFVDMPPGTNTLPITGSLGRPTAMPAPLTLDTSKARLFVQDRPGGPMRALSPSAWAFADCADTISRASRMADRGPTDFRCRENPNRPVASWRAIPTPRCRNSRSPTSGWWHG